MLSQHVYPLTELNGDAKIWEQGWDKLTQVRGGDVGTQPEKNKKMLGLISDYIKEEQVRIKGVVDDKDQVGRVYEKESVNDLKEIWRRVKEAESRGEDINKLFKESIAVHFQELPWDKGRSIIEILRSWQTLEPHRHLRGSWKDYSRREWN